MPRPCAAAERSATRARGRPPGILAIRSRVARRARHLRKTGQSRAPRRTPDTHQESRSGSNPINPGSPLGDPKLLGCSSWALSISPILPVHDILCPRTSRYCSDGSLRDLRGEEHRGCPRSLLTQAGDQPELASAGALRQRHIAGDDRLTRAPAQRWLRLTWKPMSVNTPRDHHTVTKGYLRASAVARS